ncbi:hypothetical protein FQ330_11325 [Agrococcus sediminis]|uniref:Secreted protein n=1 Tax=Agrococcus sediminis TaxID=2599924 RepID=A0A5M8Q622_9MICO|nr:hypothetical protein [Agrococcus sediminis]KAA6431345.1 hypothetical protein FQ330_11325 [Agrococcus sediminis]
MKKTLAALGVAGLAVVGLAAPAQAAPPPHAEMNHESYWENLGYGDCEKMEFDDGVGSFTLPEPPAGQQYTLLVLKAGSGAGANDVIPWPAPGTYWHSSDKDLSHVIYCMDGYVS